MDLVTLEDVRSAAAIIAGRVHRTPVARSAYLSDRLGAEVYLKLENLQRTGSFKLRGALNKMTRLSAAERARGVATVSAGNHAQAVAWAAREAGTHATVVMPAKAVRSKIDATRGYGAEVILTDGDLRAVVAEIAESRQLTMVPAFDDPAIIAGAGTVGDEVIDDVPDASLVVVGIGGGGLASGVGVAVRGRRPTCQVVGVEPEGAAGMRQSLDRGVPQALESVNTVADGLAAPWAGDHTFAHVRVLLHDVVTIPDSVIVDAMWVLFERCKVVAEPAAAAGLGALLCGAISISRPGSGAPAPTIVCIISGGNIDREKMRTL